MRLSLRHALKAALGSVLVAAASGGCSTTPPEEPVRTLERAERIATLCLQVRTNPTDGSATEPLAEAIPLPEDACNARSANFDEAVDGEAYPNHLFVLATQTLRGELGVIDMTRQQAVDVDRSTPGFNFLPVGEAPTDVVATKDSRWAFVASAAAQKPGLYAVPSSFVLGDNRGGAFVPKLTDLMACSLPAAPNGLALVPNGGTGPSPYDIVVILPGDRLTPARLVGIDIASFTDPRLDYTSDADAGAEADADAGAALTAPTVTPGTFDACPIKYIVEGTLPPAPAYQPDVEWSDGTPYIQGNALSSDVYPLPVACGAGSSSSGSSSGGSSSGTSGSTDAGTDFPYDAGSLAPLLPSSPARFGRATQDDTTLYVADLDNPLIHVFDLSVSPPVEVAPLEVVSSADPTGTLSVREIAVSPQTRDFKRYLYAVEPAEGSLLVYDVTDKASTYRKPLVRPHADLQPFQPVDRIKFGASINTVTFARNDFPVKDATGVTVSGALCNPNPAAISNQSDPNYDRGTLYVANSALTDTLIGPKRLRGVFGFAALANGQIVVLDVDDWDAPCRRPAIVSGAPNDDNLKASSISEPQPTIPANGPYSSPVLSTIDETARVTREAYSPVSAPHRLRSLYYLRDEDDAEGGDRVAKITSGITLSQGNTPLATTGDSATANPLMLATAQQFADPGASPLTSPTTSADGGALPNASVRFSYELPDVHTNQDWAVSYEGALPFFTGVRGALSSQNSHHSLVLAAPETDFCALGVEDAPLAQAHAATFSQGLADAGLVPDPVLQRRVGDYVQITDEILPPSDPYWLVDNNDCWGPVDASSGISADQGAGTRGNARRSVCESTFGDAATALTSRDFPILEARQGQLVLGRYYYPAGTENSVRERQIVAADSSNEPLLAAAQCCFHNQVQFNVRAGGTWMTFGSVSQYLHHVLADSSGRCVQSCESRERLLNSRTFSLPREALDQNVTPQRSSVLAMRNPMFSFFMVDGRDGNGRVRPERDVVWRFSSANQFTPLSLSLTSTETTANPKAMRFLAPLGQIVVLDGQQQGLTLIDLRTAAFATTPVY